MNNSQVAHAWAHGHAGKGSNLTTDGIVLTSYYTTIAAHIDDIFYISADSMSNSTGKHISYAHGAIGYGNDNVFRTHAFSWSGSNPRLTHDAMIQPEVQDAIKTLGYALESTRTRKQTKINAVSEYMQRRETILKHAERVGVTITMPEYEASPDVIAEYQERKAAAAAAKEAARIKAQKKQQREDKKAFLLWLTTGAGRCPGSYIERGNDFITVAGHRTDGAGNILKQGVVLTSQGAECPLDHAVKALRFWMSMCDMNTYTVNDSNKMSVVKTGKVFNTYHTNGHKIPLGIFTLTSISETGEVKAGCHTFSAKTISAFIAQWREVLGL